MPLHLHRSNRAEALVEALARQLAAEWPADPFEAVPIVVGSRGMERWLRHELATRHGVAARLDFPFPRQAIDGAARWLLEGERQPRAAFWTPGRARDPWQVDSVAFRLVGLLRKHHQTEGFQHVAAYLQAGQGQRATVSARELLFAREVAGVIDRLLHERWDDALAWQRQPEDAPEEHRWIARLIADLRLELSHDSPAERLEQLRAASLPPTDRALYVFGLSTLGRGDLDRMARLSEAMHVHLFVLAPSDAWWADVRTRGEARLALRKAKTEGQRREVEAQLASQNPVLAALGGPSRDLQAWLEEVGYAGDDLDFGHGSADTALTRLQRWMAAAEGLPAPDQPPRLQDVARDGTLSAHATFGAMRQVEVLRDELLALLAADPTLTPRDIVVMTPDIETYAPLVAAVFARRGRVGLAVGEDGADSDETGRLPALPTAIADLGLRRTNPMAEVVLRLLELAGERVTVTRLLDLLALEPVRRRFGLEADDLADVRDLARRSGMRWALDGHDREQFQQPGLDQNTIRFGLERLALGVLLPDDDGDLATVPGPPMPLVPEPVRSREQVARVGTLMAFTRIVAEYRARLITCHDVSGWRDLLVEALDALATTTQKAGWLRTEAVAALDAWRDDAQGMDLPVEPAAVLRWLQGRFEMPQHGDRPITGAVTVCALEPMRSVPFRVVALLGMDDGAFPRATRQPAWDPFADHRRSGERDRRDIDRHLLLEALLSARERLLILWSGRDVRTGKALPAAVPVEELLETLGRLTGLARRDLVAEHPLQLWSPGNFDPQAPRSFDAGLCQAAQGLLDMASGKSQPEPMGLLDRSKAVLPPERLPARRLSVAELAEGLVRPQKLLLERRMGLRLQDRDEELEDREPLALEELDGWQQRNRLLVSLSQSQVADDSLLERAVVHAAGRGELPLQAGGRRVLRRELDKAQRVLQGAGSVAGTPVEPPVLELVLDPQTVVFAPCAMARGMDGQLLLQWTTASSRPNEKLRLQAWLTLLVARALQTPVQAAQVVGSGEEQAEVWLVPPDDPAQARRELQEAVDLWRLARHKPLPLFAKTSPALAEVVTEHGLPLQGRARMRAARAVADAWSTGERCDSQEPGIVQLFGDLDPLALLDDPDPEGLVHLARRVWGPVLDGQARGMTIQPAWCTEVQP